MKHSIARAMIALVLLAIAAISKDAHAGQCEGKKSDPNTALYCSASWAFSAPCNDADLVYQWKITDGTTKPTSYHIDPWEDVPITVRGIELTVMGARSPLWLMAGNGIVPDAMLFLGAGDRHGRHDFPAGTGMPMMAKTEPHTWHQYFDLHGACQTGLWQWLKGRFKSQIDVLYTVYYTVP